MKKNFPCAFPCAAMLMALTAGIQAQRLPDIGYVYPAGAQPGSTLQVKLAGRFLDGVTNAYFSGDGIRATVLEYVKPLNGKQINLMRDRLKALQKSLSSAKRGSPSVTVRDPVQTNLVQTMDRSSAQKELSEIKERIANPKNRNRENPQLAEDVTLRIAVAPDATPGRHELRLGTAAGLSNPLSFYVDQWPEYTEKEPNNTTPEAGILSDMPLLINGQIMPGDVDRFRLKLRQGVQLVVVVRARELIPYLADAVPGWFQATLALYDLKGNELAYADDFRFNPDPVLHYKIPGDGEYVLEIKDAIYRGREDFVYRITVGELPYITSIYPLGSSLNERTVVSLQGWNLPTPTQIVNTAGQQPGVTSVAARKGAMASNPMPFAVDTLPDTPEKEPNNDVARAQPVKSKRIINGRIDQPNDWDVFQFEGQQGDTIVGEVYARRLNSPLDSVLRLTDAKGKELAFNDDHEDKGAGLTTHHADSRISRILPANGAYYLHVGDAQRKGGEAFGYRLRLSPPQPDFELRIVPPSLNVRAGSAIPVTVYALRKDGFAGHIDLVLKNAPRGFVLNGSRIPAGQDQVKLTLKAPLVPTKEPITLQVEGQASIQGKEVVRVAVPAQDMMQAFIYRHLVPVQDLEVAVIGRGKSKALVQNASKKTAKTPSSRKSQTQ